MNHFLFGAAAFSSAAAFFCLGWIARDIFNDQKVDEDYKKLRDEVDDLCKKLGVLEEPEGPTEKRRHPFMRPNPGKGL